MLTNQYYLSFCVPVHNEGKIVLAKIAEIQKELDMILQGKNYEILVVENGSTDNTLKELQKIKSKNVNIISLNGKGHGLALKTSIVSAKGKHVLLTAIDLPFGFSDLEEMLKIAKEYHVIFGSKAHPESITYSPRIRRVTSKLYRMFLRLFFKIKVGDTQGTVFLKRALVLPLLKYCNSDNAFFSAQLAIFAQRQSLKITEVPVRMRKQNLRRSKYNVLSNGSEMFLSMFKTFLALSLKSPKP
jgi:glycosyltransferase involved in cell wall biosynthesis